MTRRSASTYRNYIVVLAVALGLATAAARWGLDLRPRGEALRRERESLQADRLRLAQTRARLLQLGSEGIAERNRALRAEVERREALAPGGSVEPAAAEVRERFATLAARYGVHAPSFEPVPVRSDGELQIGGLRIRAAGGYHALGTWITEALSQERLLDVQQARLESVPDTLTRRLRDAAAVPASAAAGQSPPASGALELSGARPLDAVVEFVVQWYALPAAATAPASSEIR
jgi:hypothetical protein